MLNLHLPLFFLLNLICLLFTPLPNAWCYSIDHSGNTPLLIRENAPPRSQHKAFTIQDNLNLFSQENPYAPILLPASDNFVAADTINSNLPIFSLFRNPTELTQDPFTNLLYSNLRVKKILKEYAELQERAIELLGSSYESGTMDLMTRPDNNLQDTEQQDDNTRKDNNLSRALRLLLHNLSASTAARNVITYDAEDKHPSAIKHKDPIVSFSDLQTILNRNNERISTIPNGTSNTYSSSEHINYQTETNASADQSTKLRTAKISYQASGEINLPWILDLPFKLFDFALSHKVIALITGFFFLMLLNIIFGDRS